MLTSSNFRYFIENPVSALLLGISLAANFISCVLALGFYFRLKRTYLLHFGLFLLTITISTLISNINPQDIHDLQGEPAHIRAYHLISLAAHVFLYCFVVDTFRPSNGKSKTAWRILFISTAAAITARAITILTIDDIAIKVASFFSVLFLLILVVAIWATHGKSKDLFGLQIGISIFCLGFAFFPILRSGVFGSLHVPSHFPFILLFSLSTISVFCLFNLFELAIRFHEEARLASSRNVARTLIQLRDLMNSPLQVMEICEFQMRERAIPLDEGLDLLRNSIDRLQEINVVMSRYEKDVDWEQTDNLFDIETTHPKEDKGRLPPFPTTTR